MKPNEEDDRLACERAPKRAMHHVRDILKVPYEFCRNKLLLVCLTQPLQSSLNATQMNPKARFLEVQRHILSHGGSESYNPLRYWKGLYPAITKTILREPLRGVGIVYAPEAADNITKALGMSAGTNSQIVSKYALAASWGTAYDFIFLPIERWKSYATTVTAGTKSFSTVLVEARHDPYTLMRTLTTGGTIYSIKSFTAMATLLPATDFFDSRRNKFGKTKLQQDIGVSVSSGVSVAVTTAWLDMFKQQKQGAGSTSTNKPLLQIARDNFSANGLKTLKVGLGHKVLQTVAGYSVKAWTTLQIRAAASEEQPTAKVDSPKTRKKEQGINRLD